MGILDIEIVKGFMRMCNDGWLQGWHERNGGNLTYRMKEEEVAQCRLFFDPQPREWVNMGVQADNLAGEYFITTGSGKFFRNVEPDPVHSIGIVEINDKGDSWRIVSSPCHLRYGSRPAGCPLHIPGAHPNRSGRCLIPGRLSALHLGFSRWWYRRLFCPSRRHSLTPETMPGLLHAGESRRESRP